MKTLESGDRQQLAEQVASDIAERLREAVATQGRASLVVSGGSTPRPMFAALSNKTLDWSRVEVTLADERWVPPTDADSNEALVKEHLLVNEAHAAKFISLYREADSQDHAIEQVARELNAMSRPFTVVVLGMGSDGHTASLFPDAPELQAAMQAAEDEPVMFLTPPSVPQTRISLTYPRLIDAECVMLHLTGEDKRAVLGEAMTNRDKPIAEVVEAAGDRLTLYWAE